MKTRSLLGQLLALVLGGTSAHAVIIAGGDGQGNTNAPADDPGWNYVGQLANKASGVTYLGSNWFITAYHIKTLDSPAAVLLNGATYDIDSNSWSRLTNSNGTSADLEMFRVDETVSNMPALSLRITTPSFNASVVMIGNGKDRETNASYWTASWQLTNAAAGVYSGFYWSVQSLDDSGTTKRWGQNNVVQRNISVDDGYGTTTVFSTMFDAAGGTNEALGALYDSGGGVFLKSGSTWQLAGMMITADSLSGQPDFTAVYGNSTYIADLSAYNDQIVSLKAIPEPASMFIMGAGALLAVRMIRRWRT